jgi:hypothetical protein
VPWSKSKRLRKMRLLSRPIGRRYRSLRGTNSPKSGVVNALKSELVGRSKSRWPFSCMRTMTSSRSPEACRSRRRRLAAKLPFESPVPQ